MNLDPVFIGGTGRSGTSIVHKCLGRLPEISSRVRENKLISEKYGFRDVVDTLSGVSSPKACHFAVHDFCWWADRLRLRGPRRSATRFIHENWARRPARCFDAILGVDYGIHSIGDTFGLEHYDRTLHEFVTRVCDVVVENRLVDIEGPVQELYIPKITERKLLLSAVRDTLRELYRPVLEDAVRWCDDTPANILAAPFLFELFPGARLIHVVRDPRDVVASYCRQKWAPSNPRLSLAQIEIFVSSWLRLRGLLPQERVLVIRLEDLVREPLSTWEKIGQFVGHQIPPAARQELDASRSNVGSFIEILTPKERDSICTRLNLWMAENGYLDSFAS